MTNSSRLVAMLMPASRRRGKFLTVFHQDERINQLNANAGFNRTNGVIILDWQDGYATARVDLMAQHLNPAGLVHGGLYATMLDVVLAMSGCYRPPPEVLIPGLTLSLTTQFLSAMRQEDKYATATARRRDCPYIKMWLHFSISSCHPCARAMLFFSVSFNV